MMGNESPDCVLWGGYEGRNGGDELTLAVALRDAHSRFGEYRGLIAINALPRQSALR